jgi:hypothetical protein
MPLRSIAFISYFLGSCGLSLAMPMIGVVCYLVLYHVYPQTTWWGARLSFLGIRYSFVCGLCLLIGTALNMNRLRFGRRFLHPIELMSLAVLLGLIISSATGGTWSIRTDFVLDKMSKVILFGFVMAHVVVTRNRLWQISVLLMILALYLGHEAKVAPPGAFTNSRLNGIGGPDFRESAGLAIHLFALLPFVAIVLRQKNFWLKALAFLAAGYSVNAIILCRARSAFVAGILAGATAIWYVPRRHRTWVIIVLVLAILGGIVLSDTWFWERMSSILNPAGERDRSAASRLMIWRAAWDMIRENPWGVGIGQFRNRIGDYSSDPLVAGRDAHNTFVLCAAETGMLGLALYLVALGVSWYTLGQVERTVKRKQLAYGDLFGLIIFANRLALLVYMISGLFVSRFYTEGGWIFLMMPACIDRAVENEIRVETREAVCLLARNAQIEGTGPGTWLPAT